MATRDTPIPEEKTLLIVEDDRPLRDPRAPAHRRRLCGGGRRCRSHQRGRRRAAERRGRCGDRGFSCRAGSSAAQGNKHHRRGGKRAAQAGKLHEPVVLGGQRQRRPGIAQSCDPNRGLPATPRLTPCDPPGLNAVPDQPALWK